MLGFLMLDLVQNDFIFGQINRLDRLGNETPLRSLFGMGEKGDVMLGYLEQND